MWHEGSEVNRYAQRLLNMFHNEGVKHSLFFNSDFNDEAWFSYYPDHEVH